MKVTLDKNMINRSIDNMHKIIEASCGYDYDHEIKELLTRQNKRMNLLQFARKLNAIVIKILCNVNPFIQNTHFIDKNTFTQTTYYKTLTSRP